MGKKTRKTRWRTLTIDDNDYSDSEASSTTTTHQRLPKGYQPKSYYNRFSYSSQSTPRRRYQHDSTKTTRSSSTASENKITFNEDEYTKITTPRQDVLFKKGYLNKPKNYQTQTSTGTSTTSTGNSTGNGTPDHQSTDLEYESQFVYQNGFVDQNGICYININETYPHFMVYNPQTYYPEFSNFKSKRYSTGSLTESMSPNNEEATSQELSGGEASNTVSDYSGHHHVYNMVYPGYYVNGACLSQDVTDGQNQTDQTRRIKKRRRRKTSRSQNAQDSSEYTDDEDNSCNENSESRQNSSVELTSSNDGAESKPSKENPVENAETPVDSVEDKLTDVKVETDEIYDDITKDNEPEAEKVERDQSKAEIISVSEELPLEKETEKNISTPPSTEVHTQGADEKSVEERSGPEIHQTPSKIQENPQGPPEEPFNSQKSELKPDAEEFIPRAYRTTEIPLNQNVQFIKIPPNFIPFPIMPLGDYHGQNYNPTFIPSGIPINFLPPDPKMYHNFVSFVPNTQYVPRADPGTEETEESMPIGDETTVENTNEVVTCDIPNTAKDDREHKTEKVTERVVVQNVNSKTIDIATVVSKLEEAAKEQDCEEVQEPSVETQGSPRKRFNDNRINHRYNKNIPNFKRNHYNSTHNSPQRNIHSFKGKIPNGSYDTSKDSKSVENGTSQYSSENHKTPDSCIDTSQTQTKVISQEQPYSRKSPENRRSWKHTNSSNTRSSMWQPGTPSKTFKLIKAINRETENIIRDHKQNLLRKNYSTTLKNKETAIEQKSERYFNEKIKISHDNKKDVKNEDSTKTSVVQPNSTNQWISVSSRKKRKNKNTDEMEVSFEENSGHPEVDLFEKYDVDQLVDVVPAQEQEDIPKVETTEELEIKDIINNITQNETSLINNIENISLNLAIRSVDDIERELIAKNPVETEISPVETETETVTSEIVPLAENVDSETVVESNIVLIDSENTKPKGGKKSKKSIQKQVTKRVIITDIDLSMNCEEPKIPVKKIVTKINEKTPQVNGLTKEVTSKSEEKEEEKISEKPQQKDDNEEKKKNKKKKKKSNKTVLTNSLSSSNTTISNMDDSYDFLLDSALSHESVERTNIEISHELDKIIQKGMYSSLEEKIKSLNIDNSDGFFKSVFSNITSTKSTTDNTSDISKFLQDSRSLFRPSSVSQENNSQNKDINKILPDLDSPVEDGIFLKSPDETDILQDGTTAAKDEHIEDTQNEDANRCYETSNSSEQKKNLYPITEAVKEWMCRTRETTPDVEILKSPRDIYKEFCDSASDTDTVVSESMTALGDEELTIFKTENLLDSEEVSLQKEDLIEYWENDVGICETERLHTENLDEPIFTEEDHLNQPIEEGEDVIEVYDSKYGKNEDFLKLQREIKEKMNKSNRTAHGGLPYPAVCCSIM